MSNVIFYILFYIKSLKPSVYIFTILIVLFSLLFIYFYWGIFDLLSVASLPSTFKHSQVSLKKKKNFFQLYFPHQLPLSIFIHSHYVYFSPFLCYISSLESCPSSYHKSPETVLAKVTEDLDVIKFNWSSCVYLTSLWYFTHSFLFKHSLLLVSGHNNLLFPPIVDISTFSQLPQLILPYLSSKWWNSPKLSSRLYSHVKL